jgi:hypothetical protein
MRGVVEIFGPFAVVLLADLDLFSVEIGVDIIDKVIVLFGN